VGGRKGAAEASETLARHCAPDKAISEARPQNFARYHVELEAQTDHENQVLVEWLWKESNHLIYDKGNVVMG
jgi:hypothetical protein